MSFSVSVNVPDVLLVILDSVVPSVLVTKLLFSSSQPIKPSLPLPVVVVSFVVNGAVVAVSHIIVGRLSSGLPVVLFMPVMSNVILVVSPPLARAKSR